MTRPTLATPSFTDRDIDELSWQFLKCDYAGPWYIDWSLDQRLTGFLRQQGLDALPTTAICMRCCWIA